MTIWDIYRRVHMYSPTSRIKINRWEKLCRGAFKELGNEKNLMYTILDIKLLTLNLPNKTRGAIQYRS